MFVDRWTIHVKTGCMQELLALMREPWEEHGATFYVPCFAQMEIIEVHLPFEKMADLDETMAHHLEGFRQFPMREDVARFHDLIKSVKCEIMATL